MSKAFIGVSKNNKISGIVADFMDIIDSSKKQGEDDGFVFYP